MKQSEWEKIRLDLEQSPQRSNKSKISAWKRYGRPVAPPSAYKQELIKAYARAYELPVLVETGTYFGETVQAALDTFREIFTVELSRQLYEDAIEKFKAHPQVHLYQGDSSKMLRKVLRKVKRPTLFWLDAHFSGGVTAKGKTNTPVLDELALILKHKVDGHLILIDDARHFVGEDDYPSLSQIKAKVTIFWPHSHIVNRHDVIRIQPDDQHIEV